MPARTLWYLVNVGSLLVLWRGAWTLSGGGTSGAKSEHLIACLGLACGLPYAIAAQIAYPGRQCIAFVGDGGFTMLMGEFATAVKYQLPIKVIIVKNNTLGQIKWEQMVFLGNPEYGNDLQPIDFAGFARACGGTGRNSCLSDECSSHRRH